MKRNISNLAVKGGPRLFETPLPVGQLNIPSWEKFEKLATSIFDRRYYTNHGILAQELEEKLCRLFNVRHAVTVTNATIGLSLACKALGFVPGDKVIVPAFTFAATVQALSWAGIEPVFCDVDQFTHCITPETVAPYLLTPGVRAVLGVHLWGNACNVVELESLTTPLGISVFYDAAHAVGCTHQGREIGGFGACEVFSFHATKVLNATEGGCVTTNDDALAERVRNLRSSYGRHAFVSIPVNANGRFSEMQAAFTLLSLEDLPANCKANKLRQNLYVKLLQDVPGLHFICPHECEKNNFQYIVIEVDQSFGMDRDELVKLLNSENILARRYFVPGMHRCLPYSAMFPFSVNTLPVTDALCRRVMQLPSGQMITESHIEQICELIRYVNKHALELKGTI